MKNANKKPKDNTVSKVPLNLHLHDPNFRLFMSQLKLQHLDSLEEEINEYLILTAKEKLHIPSIHMHKLNSGKQLYQQAKKLVHRQLIPILN